MRKSSTFHESFINHWFELPFSRQNLVKWKSVSFGDNAFYSSEMEREATSALIFSCTQIASSHQSLSHRQISFKLTLDIFMDVSLMTNIYQLGYFFSQYFWKLRFIDDIYPEYSISVASLHLSIKYIENIERQKVFYFYHSCVAKQYILQLIFRSCLCFLFFYLVIILHCLLFTLIIYIFWSFDFILFFGWRNSLPTIKWNVFKSIMNKFVLHETYNNYK